MPFYYRIYDLIIESDIPWGLHPTTQPDHPDITISATQHKLFHKELDSIKPVFSSRFFSSTGENRLQLYRLEHVDVLRFPEVIFYLQENSIRYYLQKPDSLNYAWIYLQGVVIAYWFELNGMPVLHASSVVANNQVIAFLASSGVGKSTLAGAFMQKGYPLFSDDILPIEQNSNRYSARPGPAMIRMWPQAIQYFTSIESDVSQSLPEVMPGVTKRWVPAGYQNLASHSRNSLPLSSIWVIERVKLTVGESNIFSVRLSPLLAVIELLRNSFTGKLVDKIGLSPYRLEFFSKLIKDIPVWRIAYPDGFENLGNVCNFILDQLNK